MCIGDTRMWLTYSLSFRSPGLFHHNPWCWVKATNHNLSNTHKNRSLNAQYCPGHTHTHTHTHTGSSWRVSCMIVSWWSWSVSCMIVLRWSWRLSVWSVCFDWREAGLPSWCNRKHSGRESQRYRFKSRWREWALFSLMPSALSFVFLWHTNTHTHTHTHTHHKDKHSSLLLSNITEFIRRCVQSKFCTCITYLTLDHRKLLLRFGNAFVNAGFIWKI